MNKKKTTRSCHKEKTSNKFSGLKDYITNKCFSFTDFSVSQFTRIMFSRINKQSKHVFKLSKILITQGKETRGCRMALCHVFKPPLPKGRC